MTETAWAEDLKGNNVLTESAEGLEGCEEFTESSENLEDWEEFTESGFGGSEEGLESLMELTETA